MRLIDILTPDRTVTEVQAESKKRILEIASELAAGVLPQFAAVDILDALLARERLGSTSIGHGIALPHCRLVGLAGPIAVLIMLAKPVDYDALDEQLVDIVLTLLVPDQPTDEHLQLLAHIAEFFSQESQRVQIRKSQDKQTLYTIITDYYGQR